HDALPISKIGRLHTKSQYSIQHRNRGVKIGVHPVNGRVLKLAKIQWCHQKTDHPGNNGCKTINHRIAHKFFDGRHCGYFFFFTTSKFLKPLNASSTTLTSITSALSGPS